MASIRFRAGGARRIRARRAALALAVCLALAGVGVWVGVRGGTGVAPGDEAAVAETSGGTAQATASGGAALPMSPAAGPDEAGATDGADAVGKAGTTAEAGATSEAEMLEGLLGDLAGELPEEVAGAPVRREESERAGGVAEVASALVGEYRELGGAVVAHAGYLDLLGNVWGMVVMGPGWVDLCLVSERSGDTCELTRLRMEAEEWERSYGGEDG